MDLLLRIVLAKLVLSLTVQYVVIGVNVAASASRTEQKQILKAFEELDLSLLNVSSSSELSGSSHQHKSLMRTKRAHYSLQPLTTKWPMPQQIRWTFDFQFPQNSRQIVRNAVKQLDDELNNCVNFEEFDITAKNKPRDGVNGNDFIIVTNRQGPLGTSESAQPRLCGTRPGRVFGVIGQRIAIVTSEKTGAGEALPCLNQRVIMGLFYQMLGFHSEIERVDRMRTIAREGGVYQRVFGVLSGTQVGPFDRSSITIEPTRFYNAPDKQEPVLVPRNNDGSAFDENANLSYLDCLAVMVLYKKRNNLCNFRLCKQPP